MATRKPRKFAEGGMSDEDVKSFAGTSDNDSNAGMMEKEPAENFTPAPAKAKPKVVTKEELAKSGLSLRDYMNKQQGLTRRGEKATPKAEPKINTLAPADKNETRKALPLKSTKAEKNSFMGATGLKKGGSVKGWGQARGARKAKMY